MLMAINKKKGSRQPGESSVDNPENKVDSVRLMATNQSKKGRKQKRAEARAEASPDNDAPESPNDLPAGRKRKVQFPLEGNGSVVMESQAADATVSTRQHKRGEMHRQGHRSVKVVSDSEVDSEVGGVPAEPQTKKIRSATTASGVNKASFDQPTPPASVKTRKIKRRQRLRGSSSHSVAAESDGSVDTDLVTKTGSADCAHAARCQDEVPASEGTVVDHSDAADQKQKKKKKKKKSKGKKKDGAEQEAETEKPTTAARDAALAYLDTWKRDRSSWSFQKVRQVWLLQHMYSAVDVDKDRFEVLLEYLEPLKGNARAETVRKAEEILAKADENDVTETNDGTPAPVDEIVLLRAKEIVQHLSTE